MNIAQKFEFKMSFDFKKMRTWKSRFLRYFTRAVILSKRIIIPQFALALWLTD